MGSSCTIWKKALNYSITVQWGMAVMGMCYILYIEPTAIFTWAANSPPPPAHVTTPNFCWRSKTGLLNLWHSHDKLCLWKINLANHTCVLQETVDQRQEMSSYKHPPNIQTTHQHTVTHRQIHCLKYLHSCRGNVAELTLREVEKFGTEVCDRTRWRGRHIFFLIYANSPLFFRHYRFSL